MVVDVRDVSFLDASTRGHLLTAVRQLGYRMRALIPPNGSEARATALLDLNHEFDVDHDIADAVLAGLPEPEQRSR